jgi:large subunit ribosomal protein L21
VQGFEPGRAVYAIIESGGKQFRIKPDGRVRVPSLPGEVGERVTFDRVLYVSDGEQTRVGAPLVDGVRVLGEIVGHGRDKKIVVFKYKRRKRYRLKRGHRQGYTDVAITGIELAGAEEIGTAAERDTVQAGPYVCEECGRGFATERGLQQHRVKAHVHG